MICPECKKEIALGVNFCPYCGTSVIEYHQSHVDGIRFFCEGRYDQALRKLKVACLTDPTNPTIIKDCGHAYLHSGDLANAVECYDKAEMLGGNFIDIKYNRALLSLNERRLDEARMLLASIVENPPAFKPGQYYFGLMFSDVEHFLAEVHLYLGLILKEEKDLENALHHFKISYELNDEKISALHNLADLHLHLKQYGTAIEKYHELMNRMPAGDELIDIHINLAMAYYRNAQTEEAISELHWILRRDPGNPTAIHNLNQIYEKEGIIKGSEDQKSRIQIVNLTEGASPIFGLTRGDGSESS
ncbi:zinc-ribbon domain-containing protein, partial [Candidatus Sumerlaeota bacterium]|nr:zinc-ribbon domain-containing protein [Candidatus Sumerlaeota bacterium]